MISETIGESVTMSGGEDSLLVGRYRVVRQLGQGGMGSVWLAEDTELENRKVAIKMLPAILLSNRRSFQQIKSEALVSLKLTHPNIATLRSFEENGGNPFLVIDYIDGETLDSYLAEHGRLSEDETRRLLGPVAAALDYAHREKVVHRDVKPGNVMIRRDGVPFVLDFGIAREMQETMTRVTGKLSSGTLLYMGPEQLNGAAPSAAQDVYSFAAMAYECLSGHPPFHRGQVEYQIMNAEPEPLASDSPFARSVLRGLAKDPAARPASCRAVLGDAAAPAPRLQAIRPPSAHTPQPARASAPRAVAVDANVYVLEVEAKRVYDQKIAPLPALGVAALDDELERIRTCYLAATTAMQRGDATAAKKLFAEVMDYPVRRLEKATELALAAFDAERFEEAFKLSDQADPAHPGILFLRGFCRQTGSGAAKDVPAALADYKAAAAAGHAAAQYNLATLLMGEEGVAPDLPAAVRWYRESAEKGVVESAVRLAFLYDEGKSVPRDAKEAFRYGWQVHRAGDGRFDSRLGGLCARGEGKDVSEDVRRQLLEVAAENGDALAACRLGESLLDGDRPEDAEMAFAWLRQAVALEKSPDETPAAARLKREEERRAEEKRKREEEAAAAAARKAEEERQAQIRAEQARKVAEARRQEAERQAKIRAEQARQAAERRRAALRTFGRRATKIVVGSGMLAILALGISFGVKSYQEYQERRRREAEIRRVEAEKCAAAEKARQAEELRRKNELFATAREAAADVQEQLQKLKRLDADSEGFQTVLECVAEPRKILESVAEPLDLVEASNLVERVRAAASNMCEQVAALEPKLVLREKAREAKRQVEALKGDLTTNKVGEVYAQDLDFSGQKLLEAGNGKLASGDFAGASDDFVRAGAAWRDAIQQAKAAAQKEKVEREALSLLDRAHAAFASRNWNELQETVDSVLNLAPDNAEAKKLADKAQQIRAYEARLGELFSPLKELVAGDVRTLTLPGGAKIELVWCPPGKDLEGNEVKCFWMGKTEVTQAQWKSVMGSNPSKFPGDDNRPVENVSWNDCQEFCKKCAAAGVNVRLPTEREWEYACRAGSTGDWGKRKNGEEGPLDDMGWYDDNGGNTTHPVAQKEPNAWGSYDMHGNVWEWCEDAVGASRVTRGGGWGIYSRYCAAGYRNMFVPGRRRNYLGFRLACSQD